MEEKKRVIITGGPGTGKTSVIEALGAEGYPYFKEQARATIKEQLDKGSDLVPWQNLVGFSALVQARQKEDFAAASEKQLTFYDRGIPDVLAYLHRENHYVKSLEDEARLYLYHPQVFITPPWPEIYRNDNERREDLGVMHSIHLALVNTYETIGYKVIEVPKTSLDARLEFIKGNLGV